MSRLRSLFKSTAILFFVLSGAFLIGTGSARPLYAQDSTFERTMKTLPGEDLTLDILSGGAVHVRGWDHNSVQVRAYLSRSNRRYTQITLEAKPGGILLQSRLNPGKTLSGPANLRFEVWVPLKYNLSISSTGGELLISDVDGMFHGATAGGRIFIDHSRGRVELFTGGGEVRVSNSDLTGSVTTAKGLTAVSKVNGDVQVSSRSRN